MKIHPDQSAMPVLCHDSVDFNSSQFGLTKREHFAGLAMQAYLTGNLQHPDVTMMPAEEVAREAVAYADALIAELEKSR